MGVKIFVFTFSLFLFIGNCSSISPGVLNFILQSVISFIKGANITTNITLTVPESLQDVIVGDLNLTNLHVYGLDTLQANPNVVGLTSDRNKFDKNNISVIGVFDKIGITSEYNLDIGILDLIPLYGVGTIKLGLSKFNFYINTTLYDHLTFHNASLANLNLGISFRHSSATYITGFWKSVEVSEFLTNLLNLLEPIICMWYDYNGNCINCILSNIIEIVVNLLLNASPESGIECYCSDDAAFLQNINIESLVLAWMNKDYEYIKKEIRTNKALEQLYTKIYDTIVITMQENDLSLS